MHPNERDVLGRLLTAYQAAQALSLSIHTVRAWISCGRIASIKLGRAVRVPASELTRLMTEGLRGARNASGDAE